MNVFNITEKYQRLENEKKNIRTVHKRNIGPMIRYQSLSMPVMVLTNSHKEKEKEKETKMLTEQEENKNADESARKSSDTENKR